jgi:hypothetical protein
MKKVYKKAQDRCTQDCGATFGDDVQEGGSDNRSLVASEKRRPLNSRTAANQSMIVARLLLPSCSFACCATASSRGASWKPKSWYCGISSMSCSSAPHALHWTERALFVWLYRRCPRLIDAITIVAWPKTPPAARATTRASCRCRQNLRRRPTRRRADAGDRMQSPAP